MLSILPSLLYGKVVVINLHPILFPESGRLCYNCIAPILVKGFAYEEVWL